MKLFNVFKKDSLKKSGSDKAVNSKMQTLDKTQLEKVIGGADTNPKGGSIPFVGGALAGA